MKTIEEKAKAYDEAIERAKEWSETKNGYYTPKELCEEIFPELAESEDERIRKLLISGMKNLNYNAKTFASIPIKDAIAWLEKQGELKAAGKIEPKFKVGDWIVGRNNVYKIISLNDELNCYMAVTQNNEEVKIPYYFDDGQGHMCSYHLWTIQDAKDGDVLVNGNEIVIFKKSTFNEKDLSGCMFVHCKLRDKNGYWYTIGGINPTNYTPATKEQRDLLFQKMKEAGYMWDSKSKQLLSLKAEPSGEQKPAWSEEDEKNSYHLKILLENLTKDNKYEFRIISDNDRDKYTTWLKTLKQRYACKPSDERMKVLNEVLNFAANHESPYWNDYIFETLNNLIRQLKEE